MTVTVGCSRSTIETRCSCLHYGSIDPFNPREMGALGPGEGLRSGYPGQQPQRASQAGLSGHICKGPRLLLTDAA
jgi:hypothetical protein